MWISHFSGHNSLKVLIKYKFDVYIEENNNFNFGCNKSLKKSHKTLKSSIYTNNN